MAMKEQRVAILARNETTYNVDAIGPALGSVPSAYATDALLCSELDIVTNASTIERPNYSTSLSQDVTGISRVLAQLTFKTELRASGTAGVAPRIGRLLKACGMSETIVSAGAAAQISNPVAGPANASAPAATILAGISKTTVPTSRYDTYRITVTTGGAPATAKFMVTGSPLPENDANVLPSLQHSYVTNSAAGTVTIGGTLGAPTFLIAGTWAANEFVELFVGGLRFYYQIVTSDTPTSIALALKNLMNAVPQTAGSTVATGTITVVLSATAGEITSSATAQAVTLGLSGAQITIPVWTGALVAGEYFEVSLRRVGVRYDPISDNVSSCSFYVYLDGQLFRVLGSRGTFSIEGAAAQYPMISWTFTGTYLDPIDAALPTTMNFETSLPWKVELSALAIYGLPAAVASKFSFDAANEVTPKDNINAAEAYDEINITDRAPTVGADPEAVKPSVFSPWARLRRADTSKFHILGGLNGGPGNIWTIRCNRTSYTGAAFANRNKIRAHNYAFRAARISASGDDEYCISFH